MDEGRGRLREIEWLSLAPWVVLGRVFSLAKQPGKLLLAVAGVAAMWAGWWFLAQVFQGSDDPAIAGFVEAYVKRGPLDSTATPPPRIMTSGVTWAGSAATGAGLSPTAAGWLLRNPIRSAWGTLSFPVRQMFNLSGSVSGFVFFLLCGGWAAAVWGLFGGAISRIAAVQLTREERLSVMKSLDFAFGRWLSFPSAVLSPLCYGVLPCAIPMLIAGWLLYFGVGIVIAAVLWPLFIVLGLLAAVILFGLLLGWPLMWATISTEAGDAFDAVSTAYHYVFQRPLKLILYAAMAMFLGILSWLAVAALAAGTAYLTLWGASWTSGSSQAQKIALELHPAVRMFEVQWAPSVLQSSESMTSGKDDQSAADEAVGRVGRVGIWLLDVWMGLIKIVAIGFQYSFFWTAVTAVYLVLRLDIDGKEMDEINLLDSEEEPHDLPPLTTDAAGVPVVDSSEGTGPSAVTGETGEPENSGDSASEDEPSEGNGSPDGDGSGPESAG